MKAVSISLTRSMTIMIIATMIFTSNVSAQNYTSVVAQPTTSEVQAIQHQAPVQTPDLNHSMEAPMAYPSYLDVDPEALRKYTLGIDDVIDINVMRHPEVSGQYMINKEGKIQYEFIGDVSVAGLKKSEVVKILTESLGKFIISPEVTVKILGYNSKTVYVIGEVARPGKVFMRGDTITVREALVQAGLPLLTAKNAKSILITPADKGEATKRKINVHKLLYEGDLRENVVMKPGDTLYIPPTIMAKAMRVIQPVSAPIGAAASTGRTVTTGF